MAEFLTGKDLEEKITDIIFHAKSSLLILSPFIKLDDYFKILFTNHIKNPDVHIIILFGKNEDDKGKSLRKEDFEFFKQFPKVSILYLKDLHAKYYANDSEGVITSINLHDYSFKNNIEFGVHSKNANQSILGVATVKNPFSDSIDSTAWDAATDCLNNANPVYIKRPCFQKKFLGLSKNYISSEVIVDETNFFTSYYKQQVYSSKLKFSDFPDELDFGKPLQNIKPSREEFQTENIIPTRPPAKKEKFNPVDEVEKHFVTYNGYCIRTGDPIKYNLNKPYTNSAFESWKSWRNEDYEESYCHSCGKQFPTSKRKPLCDDCFYQ